jgi:hypothetical protein
MRRRRHKLQVSTFPFLAVLLCAMGSLILMLLVLDRRAKAAARERVQRAAAKAADEDERAAAARRQEWERRLAALHAELLGQQKELKGKIAAVHGQIDGAAAELQQEKARHGEDQKQLRDQQDLLATLERDLAQKRTEVSRAHDNDETSKKELKRLSADLETLEKTLEALKLLRERQKNTYSVVPYRGRRGDTRPPLYLECAANGVVFHPDRKVITRPRTAGDEIRAELQKRIAKQRAAITAAGGKPDPTPYLLMLVRPDGIANYYLTMQCLKSLDLDFGYELIDADWVLEFPEKDDQPPTQPWMNAGAGPAAPSSTKPFPKSPPAASMGGPVVGGVQGTGKDGQGTGPRGGLSGTGAGPANSGFRASGSGIGLPGGQAAIPGNGVVTLLPGSGGSGSTAASSGQPGGMARSSEPGNASGTGGGGRAQGVNFSGNGADARLQGDVGGFAGLPGNRNSSATGSAGGSPGTGAGDTASGPMTQATITPPTSLPQGGEGPGVRGSSSGRIAGLDGSDSTEPAAGQGGGSPGAGARGTGSSRGTGQPSQGAAGSEQAALSPTPVLPGDGSDAPRTGTAGKAGQSDGKPSAVAGSPGGSGGGGQNPGGGTGQAGAPTDESSGPRRRAFDDPLPTPKRPTRPPVLRPAGLSRNRDYVILIECTGKGVLIHPYGQSLALETLVSGQKGTELLRKTVEQMIARRQASVKQGEPPYRPQVRFLVRPDGLQALHRAYPVLEPLNIAMTRTDLEENEDVINIDNY